ncbi:MAG TPA: HAD-IIIC family phosphatase [Solirubrobacteraceae bacterium]|nr:HAD-IIIC family phosphatase [Solirubrobacteraceae bacterium]
MAANAPLLGAGQAEPAGATKGASSAPTLGAALKLVIWDLDETLWSGTLSEGEVQLDPAHAEIVRTLNRRGIMNAICSKNDLDAARERLQGEGLWEEFVFPSISWSPKGAQVAQIIEEMQLRPQNVLFIDDNVTNLQEALHRVPELQIADPRVIAELLSLPQAKGKDDRALARLAQYRVLEHKAADRTVASGSNEDFLRSCEIHVELGGDCGQEAARLADLINRSNQLNFTKSRTSEHELQATFADPDRDTGYVHVHDRYGDYGICGFYSVRDGRLTDYVFSCRILHMGVEQWLYERLGRPELTIVGDVASSLQRSEPVDWITLDQPGAQRAGPQVVEDAGSSSSRVLLKGGCDLMLLNSFLGGSIKCEFTYLSSTGAEVHADHTEVLRRSSRAVLSEFGPVIDRLPFLDRAAYASRIVRAPRSLGTVIYSVLMDYTQALYRLRGSDFVVPFWQYDVDATSPSSWPALEERWGDVGIDRPFLDWFAQHFEYLGPLSPEGLQENVRWLAGTVSKGSRLVLVNGAEIELDNGRELGRHLRHREMNEALEAVVAELPNAVICDVREFVVSTDDLTGKDIRHYERQIYLRIAESLATVVAGDLEVGQRPLVRRLRRARRGLARKLELATVRFQLR